MIVISIASKEPHVPNPYAILNRIRLEVGAFGMADASGNDTNSQATHKDAMVHMEDRGYQFSDGIYEVIAFYNHRLLDEAPFDGNLVLRALGFQFVEPFPDR